MSAINSQELEWFDASLRTLGRTVKGLRGFKYKTSTEKEHLYAAGNKPVGIQTGNEKNEGSITVLKSELDDMNAAARAAGFRDITKIPYQGNTATFNYAASFERDLQTDTLVGIAFTDIEKAMKQNDKMMEVELPFIFMDII